MKTEISKFQVKINAGVFYRRFLSVYKRPPPLCPGFSPGSIRPGSFRPIYGVGHFGLGWWVVSAHFRGESFRPWVVSAKV